MKCRLCDELGLSVRMLDGTILYECRGDMEQVTALADLIAKRATRLIEAGEGIEFAIQAVALDAIRKANR